MWSKARFALRNLLHKQQIESDLGAEISSYVDAATDEKIASGLSHDEARRRALAESGGMEQVKQAVRNSRAGTFAESIGQDIRYALRQLIRNPGFALTAIISLALGIGATSAVFSVIYAALLNPYPYPSADRIVRPVVTCKAAPEFMVRLNGPQVEQVRQVPVVEDVLVMDFHPLTLTAPGPEEHVNEVDLNANGFNDLGVPMFLGRGILPSDAVKGRDPEPVAVLSYKLWKKHFSADPHVLGKIVELDHKSVSVIGVAAPRFTWYSADLYLPLKLSQDPVHMYSADLLLKAGVSRNTANAALQPVFEQISRDKQHFIPETFTVKVQGMNDWVVKSIGGTLYLLFGAVALLLAIGCGNVSILLLARGTARQHELAVRSAVGAQRRRIVYQLLTEALLLASVGAALGVLTSYGILATLKVLLPRYAFAPEVVIGINFPVLAFSVGVALATGILFGLWPALQLSKTEVGQAMQSNARRVAGTVRGRRAHNLLVAGQIALTLLLLAAAGSAMKSFIKLLHEPLGYDPHNVMSVGLPLVDNTYTSWAGRGEYFERLRAKIAETPGVESAAIATNGTPPMNVMNGRFELPGKPPSEDQLAVMGLVSPEFFATLRIPLLHGRIWDATEDRNGAHVAVINRTMAKLYFPNGDAIGRTIKFPVIKGRPPSSFVIPDAPQTWLQIIGIVDDSLNSGLRKQVRPGVYLPYTIWMLNFTEILVRTKVPPATLVRPLVAQVHALSADQQAFVGPEDLATWLIDEPEWQQEYLTAWIFGIFASLALVLAAIGLYSVVSYTVAQRTNEFGIRMALGAPRGHLLRLVFASTALSVGSGIAAGIALSFALNTVLSNWAQGNARDPVILMAGTALLGLTAAVACIIPARRAAGVDPMTALRCE
jgi:predicted permease